MLFLVQEKIDLLAVPNENIFSNSDMWDNNESRDLPGISEILQYLEKIEVLWEPADTEI